MEDIVDFVARHGLIIGFFALAVLWLIIEEAKHQGFGGARQTPQEVTSLINKENAVVVDLRDCNVFKTGHIIGSINIPSDDLDKRSDKIAAYKQRSVVLVCAMGHKSVQVRNKLMQAGFENVYILAGGVAAWKQAELPLKKS